MWALGGILAASIAHGQEHTLDPSTLLLLHFNKDLNGAQGEAPTASQNVSFETGIFSSAAFFPSDNRLLYPAAGNISGTEGTLEFWFKPRWSGNDGLSHIVVRLGDAGGMLLGKDGGNFWRMILNRYGANGQPELGAGFYVTSEWQAGQWHHCAFTWGPTSLKVYVDGALRAQATPSVPPPAVAASSLQIGADDIYSPADGVVDELRISDRARTASEILCSYEASLPAQTQVTFNPIYDAEVNSSSPTGNFGTSQSLRIRSVDPTRNTYLKFNVSGFGGPVTSAKLRLFCNNDSNDGGKIHLVSNDYLGTTTPWLESGLTWNNAPAIGGTPLDQKGAVALSTWVEFDVTPAIVGNNTYSFGISSGSTNVAAYDSKEATSRPELVIQVGSQAPPANLRVTPFYSTASVEWDPIPDPAVAGYRIERRPAGGTFEVCRRVLARTSYSDYGLTPGGQYEYRVAAINGAGARISAFTVPVTAQTDANLSNYSRHKSLETLIAFYQGGYSSGDVSRLTMGLRAAMEFYWRTSRGRLLFDPSWLYVNGFPPAPAWGPIVESDLRSRGVSDNQYDLAYLVGNGLAGCLGGYLVLGSTCASLGTECGVAYPGDDPAVDYTIAWTFTHEIHHALELMENITPDTPEVLFSHFPWCYPDPLGPTGWHMDWGTHFDGIAATNRQYQDQWSVFPPPYDGYIECVDSDHDGLPDSDPRVPMDEARFGSSPTSADTDGDGLDDLAEYCRYNFRGCDPLQPDTDGDGAPDGLDEEPLYRVTSGIRAVDTPLTVDGMIEERWPVLTTGFYFTKNATPLTLTSYAAWDADALYLAFKASRRLRYMVSIDGSGEDGRFESPVRHPAGATDTDNLDNKGNHIGDTWGDGNHIYLAHGLGGADVFGRGAIAGAQVASSLAGGIYATEARIPRTLPAGAAYTWYPAGSSTPVADGLRLSAGNVIGLNVTMSNFEDSDAAEFSGTWTSLFETHSYVDLPLLPWPVEVAESPHPPSFGIRLSNPYSRGSAILVAAAIGAPGRIDLYDAVGRRVATLHSGWVPREGLRFSWNGRDDDGHEVAAGVYHLRAVVGRHDIRRRFAYLH